MNKECTNCGLCKDVKKDYEYDEIIDLVEEEIEGELISE